MQVSGRRLPAEYTITSFPQVNGYVGVQVAAACKTALCLFFQLPHLPERALSAGNYAYVDWLWYHWTAPGFTDEEHLAEVKRMLAVPGALEATLGYYRAMFDPARADPDLAEARQAADQPIMVPTVALCGALDKRAELMQGQARHFAGPYRFELVPGSSHFLQREQPQAVTELILDWFAPE
jgi:pimeloyl-ACP methyl ester carboxylesterase